MSTLTVKQLEEELKKLLLTINNLQAKKLLEDLNKPDKCTPALYSQVIRFLQMHNFELSKIITPDDDTLKELASKLPSLEDYDPEENDYDTKH